MADRIVLLRAVDANNAPVAGAKATFFEAGTTTPLEVYADEAGTTPIAQPLLADASGDFAATYATQSVRVVVTTPGDVTLGTYPSDPHYITTASASSAASTTFSPITGNAATNVQAAIANNVTSITALQALWAAVTGFGRSLIATANASAARTVLELVKGTAVGNVVALEDVGGSPGLPAVDGSQLTGLASPVKAWVQFDGTGTPAIAGQLNVASITDLGTGTYRVNFTTAMPNANYAAIATAGDTSAERAAAHIRNITTASFEIYVLNHGNGAAVDADTISATVIG